MNNIRVADDFAVDPVGIREAALRLEFKTVEHGGGKYSGIGLMPLDLSNEISELVGFPVKQKLSFFRINRGTDAPSTFIHADSSESEFAGVLHLSAPHYLKGGTAFWTHKVMCIDRLRAANVTRSGMAERLNWDGHDESLWEMTGYCAMKFNRFITYPACMFHSRYPKETWGTDNVDSRLIWACFYDRA